VKAPLSFGRPLIGILFARAKPVACLCTIVALCCSPVWAQPLTPVPTDNWGLKIVIFDVGQGDGALLLTPNGQAVIIDTGETQKHGETMAKYLLDKDRNGVKKIETVQWMFVSHYHKDHIGGVRGLAGKIKCIAAFDQGPALLDHTNPKGTFTAYVRYVGDKDDDGREDPNEFGFVRHRARYGQEFKMGANEEVSIHILSVNGDTAGTAHDLPLSPITLDSDLNPGSIIQLVTLKDFEYLTTGDTTSDDWKKKPDSEEALIHAHAIPGGHDIDVLKVAHHGSDTSSGRLFIESLRPEVAIISSTFKRGHKLPKLTSIKILETNGARVLVTGRARDNKGKFHQSTNAFDDGYVPQRTTDELGTITIFVAKDGSKYTIRSEKKQLALTFSSKDN